MTTVTLGGGRPLHTFRASSSVALVMSPQAFGAACCFLVKFCPSLFRGAWSSPFLPKLDGTVYAGRNATTNCLQSDISALILCMFVLQRLFLDCRCFSVFSLVLVWAVLCSHCFRAMSIALLVTHAGRLDRDALQMTDISECCV